MKIIFVFGILIFFCPLNSISQKNSKVHIEEVTLKGDTLNILFENESNKCIIVPVLEYRVGRKENTLFTKYFKYSGDTIFIYLKKEVDKDLYTVNVSHKTSPIEGKFYYTDKKLSPKMNYWTSIKLYEPGNLKVLVLKYEDFLWISSIN